MLAVIQRVSSSSVTVDSERVGEIAKGLTVLLGVVEGDSERDAEVLINKIVNLRIFADENGKMNRSLIDIGGQMLVVSQFTLAANIRKGRRPSFDGAAAPKTAEALYKYFMQKASEEVKVESGSFGANMQVDIQNDGPVTIVADSKELR